MTGILAKLKAMASGLDIGGAARWLWGWVAWSGKALMASVWAFVASPTVWLAGALFFATGWVAAFSVGHVKPKVDRSEISKIETSLAVERNRVAALGADLTSARAALIVAEQRAKAAEDAAAGKVGSAAAPKPAPRIVYRTAKPAKAGPADPFAINWPKF